MAAKSKKTTKAQKRIECPECGTKNSSKTKFCSNCGVGLQTVEEQQKIKAQEAHERRQKEAAEINRNIQSKGNRSKLYIAGGVLIVLIIAAVFFLNSSGSNKQLGTQNQTQNTTQAVVSCTVNSCQSGYYCSSYGACLKAYCGDGVCTQQEKTTGSCPIDCGCSSGQVLNKYTNECQQSLTISNANITIVVDNYLAQNKINGTITNITNGYYGSQAVKEAFVNCAPPSAKYPCQMAFYINSTVQIVNVTITD